MKKPYFWLAPLLFVALSVGAQLKTPGQDGRFYGQIRGYDFKRPLIAQTDAVPLRVALKAVATPSTLTSPTISNPTFTGTVSHSSTPIYYSYNLGAVGDANYERFGIIWTSNVVELVTQNGGAGALRAMRLTGGGGAAIGIGVTTGTNWAVNTSGHWVGTGGLGYTTGAGGAVTQLTSKATGVELNKATGEITMNAAALAADAIVSFVLTNSAIEATDVLILNHASAGTPGAYTLNARAAAGSATIDVANRSAGSLSEAIVIRYAVIKAATS